VIQTFNAANKATKNRPVKLENQFVISLGTGKIPSIPYSNLVSLVSSYPVNSAISLLMNVMSESVHEMISERFDPRSYLRVNADVSFEQFIRINDTTPKNLDYLTEKAKDQFGKIDKFFSSDNDRMQSLLEAKAPAHS